MFSVAFPFGIRFRLHSRKWLINWLINCHKYHFGYCWHNYVVMLTWFPWYRRIFYTYDVYLHDLVAR